MFVIEQQDPSSRASAVDEVDDSRLSRPDFELLAERQRGFEALGGFNLDYFAVLSGADCPRTVCRVFVTIGALEALEVQPVVGLGFGASAFQSDAAGEYSSRKLSGGRSSSRTPPSWGGRFNWTNSRSPS